MSELQEIQKAAVAVLEESVAAYDRGEIDDTLVLGIRLTLIALMMKQTYRPGALKIANEYMDAVGLNYLVVRQQLEARIYERVQINRLEEQL